MSRHSNHNAEFYYSSKPVLVVLVFVDTHAESLYWEFQLSNSSQVELLRIEVQHYNKWISLLKDGLAPYDSYDRENYGDAALEIPDEIYLAQNRKYDEDANFERPGARYAYMTHEGYQGFELYNLSQSGYHPEEEEEDKDELWSGSYRKHLRNVNLRDLQGIITDKFSLYNSFGMGYRILPMTAHLINDSQNYQPDKEILKQVFDSNSTIQRKLAEKLTHLDVNDSDEQD